VAKRSGGQRRNGGSDDQQERLRSEAQRAEELLEEWGGRVGSFLASAAARAREEAEDIWAEAQSVRRGERD
jgi:phosphohistidine phosphatase SixA